MTKMPRSITRQEYQAKLADLDRADTLAEQAYFDAAMKEELGDAEPGELAKARAHRDRLRERREVLRLAVEKADTAAQAAKMQRSIDAHEAVIASVGRHLDKRSAIAKSVHEAAEVLAQGMVDYRAITDAIRREVGEYHATHRRHRVRVLDWAEGLLRALDFGPTLGVTIAAIMDRVSPHSPSLISGDRHALRGKTPEQLESQAAERVRGAVAVLHPEGSEEERSRMSAHLDRMTREHVAAQAMADRARPAHPGA